MDSNEIQQMYTTWVDHEHQEYRSSFLDTDLETFALEFAEHLVGFLVNPLIEENKRLKFMVDNGLGWEDMKNDISPLP